MPQVFGNHTNYGEAIGILMLETYFPRIPGDIGNATTFPFPVRYYTVKGADGLNVAKNFDRSVIPLFIEGAKELERQGVRAIVTSCGFSAVFHRELADAVNVPVFSSSLIQLGLVQAMLKTGQKIGVVTADAESLTEAHFRGVGMQDVPKEIIGMEHTAFSSMFYEGVQSIDIEETSDIIRKRAAELVRKYPEIGAIVLECTNMPPFAKAVQEETGLSVFDIVSLVKYGHSAVVQTEYRGYM